VEPNRKTSKFQQLRGFSFDFNGLRPFRNKLYLFLEKNGLRNSRITIKTQNEQKGSK